MESYIGKDPVLKELVPATSRVKFHYGRVKTDLRGTRLRAAIELYQRRHNQLPDNLQDLVNDRIIDEIPIDPFSGNPFVYVDNKIYSIGPDLKDDKAAIKYDRRKSPEGDIIF